MSYNLKKLGLASLNDFFEQSNNTDTFVVSIDRYFNDIDLSTMNPCLLIEFADGKKDKFVLHKNIFDDHIIVSRKVTKNMQKKEGVARCQITFELQGDIISSDIFEINVNPSIHDTTEDENPYIPSIIADFNDSLQKMEGLVENNKELIDDNANNIQSLDRKIQANSVKISANESSILANIADTLTNTANIAKNTEDISVNTENISVNATNIAKSAEDIVNLQTELDSQINKESQDIAGLDGRVGMIEEDFSNVTVDVSFDCETEMTGKIGHEYDAAIGDQQVVIKKINGKTQRLSRNLLDYYSLTYSYFSYSVKFPFSGEIIINGTLNTDYVVGWTREFLPGVYSFGFERNKDGFGGKVEIIYADNTREVLCYDNEECNCKNMQIDRNFVGIKYTIKAGKYDNLCVKPMLVIGDTLPANYVEYENRLINAKADIISTGRNLFKSCEDLIPVLGGDTYYTNKNVEIEIFDKEGLSISRGYKEGGFSVPLNAKNMCVYFDENQDYSRYMLNYGSAPLPYEPHKEYCTYICEELGEWDYIEGQTKYKYTSKEDYIGVRNLQKVEGKVVTFDIVVDEADPYAIIVCDFPTATDSSTDDNSSRGFYIDNHVLKLKSIQEKTLEQWIEYFTDNAKSFVYKMRVPVVSTVNVPAGYTVWTNGMQYQKPREGYLGYVIDKRYNVSTKAQLLANTEIEGKEQSLLSEMKETIKTENLYTRQIVSNGLNSTKFDINDGLLEIRIGDKLALYHDSYFLEMYVYDEENDREDTPFVASSFETAVCGLKGGSLVFSNGNADLTGDCDINVNAEGDIYINGNSINLNNIDIIQKISEFNTKIAELEATVATLQQKVTALENSASEEDNT